MLRRYQCYVCAQVFDDYANMQSHILDVHEEGREYVRCPLKRCRAPVRDLRDHFRNKHPYDRLPKNIQVRATVLYDIRNPSKKKKVPSFKAGTFASNKNAKAVPYRSGYELEVYQCLEVDPNVRSYEAEPFGVPYFWQGKQRTYFPDIQVLYMDGHVELLEIKPKNQLLLEQNQAKWTACQHYCQLRGWKFIVITEPDIAAMKKATLK